MANAEFWIKELDLQAHPEGGYFKEVYRSTESVLKASLPERFTGDRNFSTSIYFLLKTKDTSAFHRIKQDEIWHFYDGVSLAIHVISPSGKYIVHHLGRDIKQGETFQVVVPVGCYFSAELRDKTSFGLVGCTVSPGFDFEDFEMPSLEELLEKFPQHKEIIQKLACR